MTNTNNKTNARQDFYTILKTVNDKNIHTFDMLTIDNKLCNQLFEKLQEYINVAIWSDENENMTISLLRKKALKELQSELLSALFFKFDKVLAKETVDHQFYYINNTINTELSDYFKVKKIDRETDSLNELQYAGSDDDKEVTREDCFADLRYSPEYVLFDEPEIKRQSAMKFNEYRKEIVRTIFILKGKQEQLLSVLSNNALNIPPREFTETLIAAENLEQEANNILKKVGEVYGITDKITKILSTREKTPLSRSAFKIDDSLDLTTLSKNELKEYKKRVADELSRLKYNGTAYVEKHGGKNLYVKKFFK